MIHSPFVFLLDTVQECPYLARGLQMVHPFCCSRFSHELRVLGCHVAMAEGDHAVAGERTAPHGTVLRPSLWIYQHAFDEPLGHPQIMNHEGEIDIDQRIGRSKPLPCRSNTTEPIDDPLLVLQKSGMDLQVFAVRDLLTTWLVFDRIDWMQRQTGTICQVFGKRRFPASGIAEHRYPLHRSALASQICFGAV
ncbi:MAG: hypothetical protein ACT4PN_06655 [Nitrospiraceae bacterium]